MLKLVLPKGSLEKATLELFEAADLRVHRNSAVTYQATVNDPRIDSVRILRPQEIPSYLAEGLFDLGIAGRDWVEETSSDVVSLGQLQYSKVSDSPVRIIVAVPGDSPWQKVEDLPQGVRISSEYPQLTTRYFAEKGIEADVRLSYGATEAKVPDIVDAIVDLTETGSSLRKAGLKIIDTLLTSRTELIANREAYEDPQKRAAMEDLLVLIQGALRARGHVLLKLNVPTAQLESVIAELPAMASPTVMALAHDDMKALETVVPKKGVNTLIPALKAAGARDILELPIAKIVE